jgi:hypothetical protein
MFYLISGLSALIAQDALGLDTKAYAQEVSDQ